MAVYIYNKEEFKSFMKGKSRDFLDYNNSALISILDPDDNQDLIPEGFNGITLRLYDLEQDFGENEGISAEQGKELLDFIYKNLHNNFSVHCTYGVSRSGAIGLFIQSLKSGTIWSSSVPMTNEEFHEINSRISPSERVLEVMKTAMLNREELQLENYNRSRKNLSEYITNKQI